MPEPDAGRSWLLTLANGLRRAWWFVRRPIAAGASGIVIDPEGKVLLVRHSYGTRRWTLPGGSAKRGENLAHTAARELEEEVGVTLPNGPASLTLLGVYGNFKQSKSDHIAVYTAREWERHETKDIEIAAAAFFEPDALPENTSGAARRRIEEAFGRRPISHDW